MKARKVRQLAGNKPLAIAALLLAGSGLMAVERQPRTRAFELEYAATVKDIPAGARHVDLWMPVPHSDDYQQIRNLKIDSPYPYKIATGDMETRFSM